MKKIFSITALSILMFQSAFALDFIHTKYTKDYAIDADSLYMLSFSAINQNKYEILEFQSKGGLILFRANNKDYILTVSKNWIKSGIKILPKDSNISSGFEVQEAIFKTIDENLDYQLKKE